MIWGCEVVVSLMRLPLINELTEIKEKMSQLWRIMCSEINADCDKRVVWNNNELARYLSGNLFIEFKKKIYNWQKFLQVLKLATGDIVFWALKDVLSWSEIVEKVSNLIKTYIGDE